MRPTRVLRFSKQLLSTVHRGTAFEHRALALLTKHMSMSLTRVGGSHDGGVDLIGWWWVPDASHIITYPLGLTAEPNDRNTDTADRRRLRVLAQCKAEKRRVGPAYLRELEGVVYRHAASVPSAPSTPNGSPPSVREALLPSPNPRPNLHPHSRPHHTSAAASTSAEPPIEAAPEPPPVALLVSESAFTRNCLLAAYASPLPFLLVHLPPNASLTAGDNDDDGSSSSHNGGDSAAGALGAIFGNPALVSARGLLGGHLEFRWERGSGDDHPGLWWRGRPLPSWTPDGEPQSDAAAVLDRR